MTNPRDFIHKRMAELDAEDFVQTASADAVRSPEDERTLAQIAYDAFAGEAERRGGIAVAWKDSCWQKEFEAAATAVRDKVMEWKLIKTAPLDNTEVIGRQGMTVEIIRFIPALGQWFNRDENISTWAAFPPTHYMLLPSPPCVPGRD